MTTDSSFDTIWEDKYATGHSQRYPWDSVVSFIFRNAPRDRPPNEVRILEVGCGTASNLWFAAREGFSVSGIDASSSAIEVANKRFNTDGLVGDIRTADFTKLPFENECFDLVIDRAALTCCGHRSRTKALDEIARVTVRGGRFLFTPFAETHTSRTCGNVQDDGTTNQITEGTLQGVGQICFASQQDVINWLSPSWDILELVLREEHFMLDDPLGIHAEWRATAARR